jgi:hypothetical protein
MSQQPAPFPIVEGYLTEATLELYREFGIPLSAPVPDSPPVLGAEPASSVASVIGFAGESMRGAVVLYASSDTVRHWEPRRDSSAPLALVHDKIGEFANMLVGRLKYRFLLRSVSFLFGTPTTASGPGLSVLAASGESSRWLRFDGPGGALHVRLDAVFEPGFAFKSGPGSHPPSPAGEMMLF